MRRRSRAPDGDRATTSCGRAISGSGRSTSADDAPAAAAAATKSWPSTWSPGIATNSEPGPDVARVVRHAADRDVGETGRADRPAVAAGPAQPALGGQAVDQVRRGRAASVGSAAARRSAIVRRRSSPHQAGDAGREPSSRVAAAAGSRARGRRSAPATARRSDACAGRGRTSARPRPARGAPRARRRHRGPSRSQPSRIASWMARQRSRWSAPGCVRPGRRRGRPSGRSRGGRRGGTGPGPPAASRRHRRRAPRGRRGGRPRGPPATSRRTRPAAEREVASLPGREQQVVEAVERRLGRLGRGRRTPPRHRRRPRRDRRGGRRRSADALRGRGSAGGSTWRCGRTRASSSTPSASGSEIRWRDGWISSIGAKPAARIAAP